jgi:EAL domain-containing protein (putative c-di-GMP-specific phosphodiesterase class I)
VAEPMLESLRLRFNPDLVEPKNKLRCFVVDDNADVLRYMPFALRRYDLVVEGYASIPDMADALSSAHPNLIFLDVWLDGSDAIDALRVLTQHGYAGHVQLMSGRDLAQIEPVQRIGEARKLRMLPILQKPFRPDDLRNVLHRMRVSGDIGHQSRPSELPLYPAPTAKIDLGEALEKGWLELWYQPKLNIQRNRVEGAEGLIRARHPTEGLLLPDAFLPDASERSLLSLTEFVITTALSDWVVLSGTEHSMRLAVNAPVCALTKVAIPALIRDHAPKTPRWPGLIIEVTEDEIIRDIPLAQEMAAQMSLYNVSLAIDDFGAGFSSFARLKALPFCELKLDRSFVKNCASDRTNQGLTQTIIDLAHRFGSASVAEGVENGSDLLALFQMGCDMAQGFHLAPPMSRDQLAWMLRPRNQAKAQSA